MISVKKADRGELSAVLALRREMLAAVNGVAEADITEQLMQCTLEYLRRSEQTTVLALADGDPVGCATICYVRLLPTFSHPTGKRAHLMNVYVREGFRRQGAARAMVSLLIDEARSLGATCVSLDATESGRPLYESLGFVRSGEHMELNF